MRVFNTKTAVCIVAFFAAIALDERVEAAGCTFDQIFIGQIRRTLQSSENANIKTNYTSDKIQSMVVGVDSNASTEPMRGYRVLSSVNSSPRGYILALPGNAQSARALIEKISPLSNSGYDLLAFDYRGLLEGKSVPRVDSLIRDTKNLVLYLNAESRYVDTRHVIYGVSTGGIFALQALSMLSANDLVILDSVPDKLPFFLWCEKSIHPFNAQHASKPKNINRYFEWSQRQQGGSL
jgi:hypothetical protein